MTVPLTEMEKEQILGEGISFDTIIKVLTYLSLEAREDTWARPMHLGLEETTERMCRQTPVLRSEVKEEKSAKSHYLCQYTCHSMPFLIKVHSHPLRLSITLPVTTITSLHFSFTA